MSEHLPAQTRERWVGPDLVRIEGELLVIYSRRDMSDWVVREFCRPTIWFQDQKFFLLAKERVKGPCSWRYSNGVFGVAGSDSIRDFG